MVADQTVVITGEHITAVGSAGKVAVPAGARRIDGRGKTLLPGLWDMHGHVAEADGRLYLAAGVTGVRDLGNSIDRALDLRERWAKGEEPGPRLVLGGLVDGPGATRIGRTVATPEEARATVRHFVGLGFRQIKVYNGVPGPVVQPLIDEAKVLGIRVGGHVPKALTTREAVAAGFEEIHHLNALFRDFLPASPVASSPLAVYAERARQSADLDLDGAEVRGLVKQLVERGVVVDPTLSVFEDSFLGRPGRLTAGWKKVLPRLPANLREEIEGKFLPLPADEDALFERGFAAYLTLTRKLYEAGVTLVAGTDQPASGPALHRELELYAEAGIPPLAVLRIATLGAARVAGAEKEVGSIEVGKLADLILVPGDPSRNLGLLRGVEWTLRGGRVHLAADLWPPLVAPR